MVFVLHASCGPPLRLGSRAGSVAGSKPIYRDLRPGGSAMMMNLMLPTCFAISPKVQISTKQFEWLTRALLGACLTAICSMMVPGGRGPGQGPLAARRRPFQPDPRGNTRVPPGCAQISQMITRSGSGSRTSSSGVWSLTWKYDNKRQ